MKDFQTINPFEKVLIPVLFLLAISVSGIAPTDRLTWFLEVFPAIIGFIVFTVTYSKFQFTRFTYWILLIHAMILLIGGYYTYANVPFFNWISAIMGWSRNNYDKVGHFFQGFTPAIVSIQILSRTVGIKSRKWIAFLSVCVCLAISASYELLEWGVSILTGSKGDAFLGTQGYIWDTQSDILFALIGACVGIFRFSLKGVLRK